MAVPAYDGQPTFRPVRVVDEAPRFAQLWESVLFDPELSSNAKVIYAVLQRMAYEAHGADLAPSMKRIAERANIKDRETVAACLRQLEERGHIRRVPRTKWESDIIVLSPPTDSHAEKTRNDAEKTRTDHAEKTRTTHAEKTRNLIETRIETNEETLPPVVPQGTPAKRATQLPEDWSPDEELLVWAEHEGISRANALIETEQFRDHWQGKGETRKDWRASWRTWMRNSKRWGLSRASPNGKPRPMSIMDEIEALRAKQHPPADDVIETTWRTR